MMMMKYAFWGLVLVLVFVAAILGYIGYYFSPTAVIAAAALMAGVPIVLIIMAMMSLYNAFFLRSLSDTLAEIAESGSNAGQHNAKNLGSILKLIGEQGKQNRETDSDEYPTEWSVVPVSQPAGLGQLPDATGLIADVTAMPISTDVRVI